MFVPVAKYPFTGNVEFLRFSVKKWNKPFSVNFQRKLYIQNPSNFTLWNWNSKHCKIYRIPIWTPFLVCVEYCQENLAILPFLWWWIFLGMAKKENLWSFRFYDLNFWWKLEFLLHIFVIFVTISSWWSRNGSWIGRIILRTIQNSIYFGSHKTFIQPLVIFLGICIYGIIFRGWRRWLRNGWEGECYLLLSILFCF